MSGRTGEARGGITAKPAEKVKKEQGGSDRKKQLSEICRLYVDARATKSVKLLGGKR